MSDPIVPEDFFPPMDAPYHTMRLSDLLRNIRATQQLDLSDEDLQRIHDFMRALCPDRVAFHAVGFTYPFDIDDIIKAIPATYTKRKVHPA